MRQLSNLAEPIFRVETLEGWVIPVKGAAPVDERLRSVALQFEPSSILPSRQGRDLERVRAAAEVARAARS